MMTAEGRAAAATFFRGAAYGVLVAALSHVLVNVF